jgi:hypothetical protein
MIKRTQLAKLQAHLSKKEITLIIGPRQVGKSTLMELLREELEKKREKTTFLSMDFDEHKSFFETQAKLLQYIKLQIGEKKGYVFLDEIQRKENAGLFLKGLYDMHLPYKFIVSGSGSLELKENIHESLSGRKRIFEIAPVSFEEFVNFKTDYKYEDTLQEFFSLYREKTQSLLEEYMMFGGYPRVILAETTDEKREVMGEIYQSYLERDIKDLLKLEKTDAFVNLVRIMASQIGGLTNVSELSSTLGLAEITVKHYLWYMEKTFIVRKVTPFHRNLRSEITKSPMYYFYDVGLRNYALGAFGLPIVSLTSGHLFENIICSILHDTMRFTSTTVHFWRTADHAEVDFIIQRGTQPLPIEVKYTALKKPEVTRSFRSFLIKYKPQAAYIIHIGEKLEKEVEGTRVSLIPYYQLLSLELG